MKALIGAFNLEEALVGALSMIVTTSLMVRLQLYLGDLDTVDQERGHCDQEEDGSLHVTMSSAARAPLHTGDNSHHSFHVPGTQSITQHQSAPLQHFRSCSHTVVAVSGAGDRGDRWGRVRCFLRWCHTTLPGMLGTGICHEWEWKIISREIIETYKHCR